MKYLRRRQFVVAGGAALIASRAWSASPIPVAELDPFHKLDGTVYYQIARQMKSYKDVEVVVGRLLQEFKKRKKKKWAVAALAWSFLWWRGAPLGYQRVRIANITQRIAYKLKKGFPNAIDGFFWGATGLGMLALSKGILNTLNYIPKYVSDIEMVMKRSPEYFFGSSMLLLAKMYLKLPGFPLSVGDMREAELLLEKARPYQERHYAMWYLVKAEAEYLRHGSHAADKILDNMVVQIRPTTVVEKFTLELSIYDGELLRAAIREGTYSKYTFDPMMQPLGNFRSFILKKSKQRQH